MNWFQRYGFVGAYFILLMGVWIWVWYPNIMENRDAQLLVAGAAIGFLPVGYIISVLQMLIYHEWGPSQIMRDAQQKVIGKKNFHQWPHDEPTREADSLLLFVFPKNTWDELGAQRFTREWIARRTDVMAMNYSIVVATILASLLSFVMGLHSGRLTFAGDIQPLVVFVISVLVGLVMWWSRGKLAGEVITVVAALYQMSNELPNKGSPTEKDGSGA